MSMLEYILFIIIIMYILLAYSEVLPDELTF